MTSAAQRRQRRKSRAEIARKQGTAPSPSVAIDEAERERRRIRTAQAVTVIDRCKSRGEITDNQHRAAERIWSDFKRSGCDPWARSFDGEANGNSFGPKSVGFGPRAVEYNQAMKAVGEVLKPILHHVVFGNNTPSSWAEAKGMNPKHGIVVLRLALDALCGHYGYLARAKEKV